MTAGTAEVPIVTVMLPVRNEQEFLARTLSQLYRQSYPRERLEVIVADGMSTDATADIVRGFATTHSDLAVRFIPNPKRLSSAGRNLAVATGRGEYFLLIDGHVHIPSDDLIRDMVTAARKHDARVLGRPQPLSPPDINHFQRMVALARESPLVHSRESFVYSDYEGWTSPLSIGVMYRRDVFAEVGNFDEAFDAAEDLEFNYRVERAGIRCFTSPRFTVNYYPRTSLATLNRQMRRYGRGRAAFVLKHPERFRIEAIVPAGFVATTVGLLALGFFWPVAWLALGVVLGLYGVIITVDGLRVARRSDRRFSWLLPAITATVHIGLGLGFIGRIVRWPRKPALSAPAG